MEEGCDPMVGRIWDSYIEKRGRLEAIRARWSPFDYTAVAWIAVALNTTQFTVTEEYADFVCGEDTLRILRGDYLVKADGGFTVMACKDFNEKYEAETPK